VRLERGWQVLLRFILTPLLWWKSRPSLVERALDGKEYLSAASPESDTVRVAVVQLRGRLVASTAEYARIMHDLALRAVRKGAQLIVFPEDTGSYPLGGFIPGLERIVGGGTDESSKEHLEVDDAPMDFLLALLSPVSQRVYRTTFSSLARRFGVHIVAGSGVTVDTRGLVRKVGCLFGPKGDLIGTHAKTHLYPAEKAWGLTCGSDIEVFQTAVGRIALPICMDHTYFEPIRIGWLKGAEVIIDPAADAAEYDSWAQARGVWSRVQESPAYGIGCFMVGRIMGVTFGGRSGVYAPVEMTTSKDGVIAQATTGDEEEILVVDLDLRALREYRASHLPRFNLDLCRRYLPAAYEWYRRGEAKGRRLIT